MSKGYPTTREGVKPLYEGVRRLHDELIESTTWFDGEPHLNEDQLDALQWAKEFMEKYERKHKK